MGKQESGKREWDGTNGALLPDIIKHTSDGSGSPGPRKSQGAVPVPPTLLEERVLRSPATPTGSHHSSEPPVVSPSNKNVHPRGPFRPVILSPSSPENNKLSAEQKSIIDSYYARQQKMQQQGTVVMGRDNKKEVVNKDCGGGSTGGEYQVQSPSTSRNNSGSQTFFEEVLDYRTYC